MPKTIAGPLRQHVWLCLSLSCALSCFAQSNSGTVRGTVADPSGAVISGAVVSVDNPVSHYSRSTVTDNQGKFEFDNLPYNNYHLTVVATRVSGGRRRHQRTVVRADGGEIWLNRWPGEADGYCGGRRGFG